MIAELHAEEIDGSVMADNVRQCGGLAGPGAGPRSKASALRLLIVEPGAHSTAQPSSVVIGSHHGVLRAQVREVGNPGHNP
jgi:hypothetical protein